MAARCVASRQPGPASCVHLDVKKQAKIPPGGGQITCKVRGRHPRRRSGGPFDAPGGGGYAFVHSAIDAYSRLASWSEVHDDERAATAIAFLEPVFCLLWHRDRATPQWQVLHRQGLRCRLGLGCRDRPHPHQALLPSDQTEKSERSSDAAQRMGLTVPGPRSQRRLGPEPSTSGSTCTTITGTTRPSEARPSAVSTTWLVRTPRSVVGNRLCQREGGPSGGVHHGAVLGEVVSVSAIATPPALISVVRSRRPATVRTSS